MKRYGSAEEIPNLIGDRFAGAISGATFEKYNPASGDVLSRVARSQKEDVDKAIESAKCALPAWAQTNPVKRAEMIRSIAMKMMEHKEDIAAVVSTETGKSFSDAMGETQAAIEMGFFIAGEGRRNCGKTTTASMNHRQVYTIRQPVGIAALVIASNTPIANVAWKAFPSIFCGNASVMKPSEDTPATAWIFAKICQETGLPSGVFNVVQGFGVEAGLPLVEHRDVDLVSFTGSYETGVAIQKAIAPRMVKCCMELGGKNALVVCDDANLDRAVNWTLSSAFSNAGQRCAAASRIIVMEKIYETFRKELCRRADELTLGQSDKDFLGPVINERHLTNMTKAVEKAIADGAKVLCGGCRATDESHARGFYMRPTILENVDEETTIARREIFGPVAILFKVHSLKEAIRMTNTSDYGLTTCIHTDNLHRAMAFIENTEAGVVVVNGGTHGSEPHMGFGGVKKSGNGWKEAGSEALDVYSNIKYVNIISNPDAV